MGVEELVVFNQHVAEAIGPYEPLTVWRATGDRFEQVYSGWGPCWSEVLGAYVLLTDGGTRVRV